MVEIIASDFEVELLAQNGENSLLAAPKNVFIHFVVFQKRSGYNDVKQFYVHRYEIASWLLSSIDVAKNTKPLAIVEGNILVSLKFEEASPMLLITFYEVTYTIDLTDSDFGRLLRSDSDSLAKIHSVNSKKDFKKKMISAILNGYDEKTIYPFSADSLTIAAFELKLFKSKKSWQQLSDYYRLLKLEYKDSKVIDPYLVDNLMSSLPIVVGKTECDCGSDACFFDLLNKAYTTFFTEANILTDGNVDSDKVELQFTKIWNELDVKQRAVMNFLDYQFENTPLINLYLLTKNASFEEYIYKMTYPYQPDSEDDLFVRKIASWVGFYLS